MDEEKQHMTEEEKRLFTCLNSQKTVKRLDDIQKILVEIRDRLR